MEKAINEALNYLGLQYFENLNIKYTKVDDPQLLKVIRNNNDVEIIYGQKSSLFRGLTLIKEKHQQNEYEFTFNRHFVTNCWMIDVSRNAVMKVSQVKKIIVLMALFGMNRLMLYTEDTYEMEKYPYFGYLRGRYSKKDLKELDIKGQEYGVELVPCIQTLDHLARMFRWDAFDDIKDGPSNFLLEEEKTYEFIEEMVKTCRECFSTSTIHIGMDECHNLGLGNYLKKHGLPINRVDLFLNHIKRVVDICLKYDFKPMIWGDMFFRLNNPNGGYYSDKKLSQEIIATVPKEVDVVYWDYYHDQKDIYEKMLLSHLDLPNKIIFAGGAWNWASFSPFSKIAFNRSKLALEVMLEHHLKDVMVTTWGDFGAECSNFTVFPCLAIFSVFDYLGKYDEEAVKSLLEAVTEEKLENMFLLDLSNEPNGKNYYSQFNCGRYYLYQDPLLGLFDKTVKETYAKKYESYLPLLKKASMESKYYKYLYQVIYDLINLLKDKVDLGVKLRKAYKEHNQKNLKEFRDIKIPNIIKELEEFEQSFSIRWRKENSAFGYDVIDGRLGYLKNRLYTSIRLLDDYLNNKIDKIEELEADILPYSTIEDDEHIFLGQWTDGISPCEV